MAMTTTASMHDPKEYKIPAALLVSGVVIYLGYALLRGGTAGLATMAMYLPVQLIVQVVLGVLACYVTARIMGTSFGYMGSAVLKLAAIFVFSGAVTFFIPYIGWLIALALYFGMLQWLFELDGLETVVLVVVIWGTSTLAVILLAVGGFAMH